MWDNIFKPVDILQKGLSAAWTRNAVIRNNIANVETPGFKASDVEFETLLVRALEDDGARVDPPKPKTHQWHIGDMGFRAATTHPKHIDFGAAYRNQDRYSDLSSIRPRIIEREGLSMRMDGNNVDIENENVKLAQNSLYYNTLIEKMNSELRRLRMAITEGR